MKPKYLITNIAASILSLSSCSLVEPGDIVNPNVDEDAFVHSTGAMATWVNGTQQKFAVNIGYWCQMVEILSDNYFNNYTRSSNVFDIPRILYTDDDVIAMQRAVGTMREMADYGLSTVAKTDQPSRDQLFTLYTVKAYGSLLAGETFVGLPMSSGGDIHPWREHLQQALAVLDSTMLYAGDAADSAFVSTLQARAYYALGDRQQAVTAARRSLTLAPEMLHQVTFDGANAVNSDIQQAVWLNWFQPLPRLDFLDPKYFQLTSDEQRPITIAKAEENYLIMAEADVAQNDLAAARHDLSQLLLLVKSRPVQTDLNDQLEKRDNGVYKIYPKDPTLSVRASADDSLRAGLIIDRQAPALITVPYISGTSVTQQMIDQLADHDSALELVYLMRQEIFLCEGRRVTDLGIRLPVCEVEAAHATNAAEYTTAHIPEFIPLGQQMDAFTVDEATKTVTITYNMNKVIVKNRTTDDIVPFE
ncbi:MAG: tetratricopeptide repeat protein [Prevotella sp.]|nr:tetratricopeptide repeat protein [Prevotella sp.]